MMGAKWRVGDGKSISVYNDSWIPGLPSGRVESSFSGLGRDIGVTEFVRLNLFNHLIGFIPCQICL